MGEIVLNKVSTTPATVPLDSVEIIVKQVGLIMSYAYYSVDFYSTLKTMHMILIYYMYCSDKNNNTLSFVNSNCDYSVHM